MRGSLTLTFALINFTHYRLISILVWIHGSATLCYRSSCIFHLPLDGKALLALSTRFVVSLALTLRAHCWYCSSLQLMNIEEGFFFTRWRCISASTKRLLAETEIPKLGIAVYTLSSELIADAFCI